MCYFIMCQALIGFTDTNDLVLMMPWVVLQGIVDLSTHGGGRAEAREEISQCGLYRPVLQPTDPRGHPE